MKNKKADKSSWIIGGTTLIGLGIGLIFVPKNVFIFLASLFIGIGLGLVIAPIVEANNRNNNNSINQTEALDNEKIND